MWNQHNKLIYKYKNKLNLSTKIKQPKYNLNKSFKNFKEEKNLRKMIINKKIKKYTVNTLKTQITFKIKLQKVSYYKEYIDRQRI